MRWEEHSKENLEAFAARMEASLNILGLPYDPTNNASNGTRANFFFQSISSWLVR